MERTDNRQLDFFSQQQKPPSDTISREKNSSFLNFIRAYEKTVLLIMGIIVTGVISYCLGVEKGRGLSAAKSNLRIDVAKVPSEKMQKTLFNRTVTLRQEEPFPAWEKKPEKIIKTPAPISEPAPKTDSGSFTIQLASFRSRGSAQDEAKTLQKKGLSPLIAAKGEYIILCVGSFSNRETAKPLLSELKKRYQDCYIRRL